ncbi:MAG: ABC transporter permease subunit [Dehalococcoidales bacterium]|nr:ABC transporter permease subunit [Dehalococcoidales bacterium]
MSIERIKNVLRNEWKVLVSEPSTIMLFTFVPLMILAEAMVAIWLIAMIGGEAMVNNEFFAGTLDKLVTSYPGVVELADIDRVRLLLLTQLNFFTLLIPTMVAIYAGAYGIVEEKVSNSLEPLLATPVRTWELLFGKAMAGFLPAMIITWICAALALGGVYILGWGYLLGHYINVIWAVNFFLISPAVAFLSFLLGIIGSSRARDHRSAQNMVLFIIFPIFILIAIQMTGVVWFTPLLIVVMGVVLCVIDLLVLRIAVRLFQRESIIIRWR